MEEAQDLCDRLAIIDHGKLLAMGTLAELRRLIGERDIVRLSGQFDPQAARKALASIDGAEVVSADDTALLLAVEGASRKLPAIFAAMRLPAARSTRRRSVSPASRALFIKLTGRALRE